MNSCGGGGGISGGISDGRGGCGGSEGGAGASLASTAWGKVMPGSDNPEGGAGRPYGGSL